MGHSEIISDPVSGVTNTTYSYDHANNRSSKTVTGGTEPGHWTYTYNKSNQLTAWEKRASDAAGAAMVRSTTLTYDDNGNRLNQTATGTAESGGVSPSNVANDQTSYTWDTSNRLVSVRGTTLERDQAIMKNGPDEMVDSAGEVPGISFATPNSNVKVNGNLGSEDLPYAKARPEEGRY